MSLAIIIAAISLPFVIVVSFILGHGIGYAKGESHARKMNKLNDRMIVNAELARQIANSYTYN
jgi:hypothetical protein